MSGLREALVNGLAHYSFCYAETHASGPSIAMPEEVELVADAVLRVLAEHGGVKNLREQISILAAPARPAGHDESGQP
jgi:hypothetical protein